MGNELTVHSHDSIIRLEQAHIDSITVKIADVVEIARSHGDAEYAFQYGDALSATLQASWAALSHLLFRLSELWGTEAFPSDQDFLNVAATRLNKSRSTIHRYIEIWKWVIEYPNHSVKRLHTLFSKPFDALWQLVGMVKADEMTEDVWVEVEKAVNKAELREIRERVRGLQRGATRVLRIMLEDNGTIKARRGHGAYRIVGVLNVCFEDEDPVVRAAIERIVRGAGMFRR